MSQERALSLSLSPSLPLSLSQRPLSLCIDVQCIFLPPCHCLLKGLILSISRRELLVSLLQLHGEKVKGFMLNYRQMKLFLELKMSCLPADLGGCKTHQKLRKIVLGNSSQRTAKGASGKGPHQKTPKIVRKCQKYFRHFCAEQKTTKIVKKCQRSFRQFSRGTNFPAHFGGL